MSDAEEQSEEPDFEALAEEAFLALSGLTREGRSGEGAYGTVWSATDVTGRRVAVKIVFKDPGEAWKREYAGVKYFCSHMKNGHEALLVVYHVIECPRFICYSMEAADNRWGNGEDYEPDTLASRLLKGRVPFDTVRAYGSALMAGLRCLHETGLVHRDLKPENIFFVNGQIKIGDIGLVSVLRGEMSVVGTPDYMPREISDGPRRDIFALGKVLYCLMSGYPVSRFPMMPPEVLKEPFFAPLNNAILKACEPRAKHQFHSIAQFQHDWENPVLKNKLLKPILLGCGLVFAGAFIWVAVKPHVDTVVSELTFSLTGAFQDEFTRVSPDIRRIIADGDTTFSLTPEGLLWNFTTGGLDSLLLDYTGLSLPPASTNITLTVDRPVALDCRIFLYRSEILKEFPLAVGENAAIRLLDHFPVEKTELSVPLPADRAGFDRFAVLFDSRVGEPVASQALRLRSLRLKSK